MDHFGAATVAIPENFGFRSEIATVAVSNLFRDRSRRQFASGLGLCRFQKFLHNQHPARPKSVLVFASSQKHAGRKNRHTIGIELPSPTGLIWTQPGPTSVPLTWGLDNFRELDGTDTKEDRHLSHPRDILLNLNHLKRILNSL